MFKANKLYVQIKRNQIIVLDLISGNQVAENASIPFSTAHAVLASFHPAKELLSSVLRKLGVKWSFFGSKIAIQQVSDSGAGLSDIEKRALRDLAEMVGGTNVIIVEREKPLSNNEALLFMTGFLS